MPLEMLVISADRVFVCFRKKDVQIYGETLVTEYHILR
jgi:hypothetical protein